MGLLLHASERASNTRPHHGDSAPPPPGPGPGHHFPLPFTSDRSSLTQNHARKGILGNVVQLSSVDMQSWNQNDFKAGNSPPMRDLLSLNNARPILSMPNFMLLGREKGRQLDAPSCFPLWFISNGP